MSIATPALTNFTAGELSPRLEGRVDLSRYFNGCRELVNFVVHPHGGASRRSGLRLAAEAGNPARRSLLVPFEFNAEQAYVLEFFEDVEGRGRMRVFKDGGLVLGGDGRPYAIETPWREADFPDLARVQSNDTMILAHPALAPRRLTRTGHAAWTLEEIVFTGLPGNWREGNWPSAVCFFEERLVLAATPDKPNTLWFSRSGDYYDFRLATREVPLDDWRRVEIADGSGSGAFDGRAGDTFQLYAGDDSFERGCALKGRDPATGETRYFRYTGDAVRLADEADLRVTFVSGAPGGAQIEAVHLGGVLNTDRWEAFAPGERIPAPSGEGPLDDDAIEATLSAAQANAIEFLVPRSSLWVGTAGGEWTVGGAAGEAVSPLSIKAAQQGAAGVAPVRPESVGRASLFVQRSGRKIRELAYHFESDGLASRDLTLLSEHITEGGIRELAYVQEPDSVLYCLRADGTLLSLTYEPEHEVYAWARQVTAGTFECLASIPDAAQGRDELWTVVRRSVGGAERRFVEVLQAGFAADDPAEAFFVDCGLTYRGEPTSLLTGLGHLAGETVQVLADGAVQPPRTVAADGTLALERPAGVIHAGLPFVSALTTMRLETGSSRGTSQTKRKRIAQVAVRFHRTLGGKVGVPGGTLETVLFRSGSDPMGRAPAVLSGDRIVKFPQGADRDALVRIVQDQPLPMTVLLLVPEVAVNE